MCETIRSLVKNNIRSACTNDTLLHLCVSRLNIIKKGYFIDGTGKRVFTILMMLKYAAFFVVEIFHVFRHFAGYFSQFKSRQIIAGL